MSPFALPWIMISIRDFGTLYNTRKTLVFFAQSPSLQINVKHPFLARLSILFFRTAVLQHFIQILAKYYTLKGTKSRLERDWPFLRKCYGRFDCLVARSLIARRVHKGARSLAPQKSLILIMPPRSTMCLLQTSVAKYKLRTSLVCATFRLLVKEPLSNKLDPVCGNGNLLGKHTYL